MSFKSEGNLRSVRMAVMMLAATKKIAESRTVDAPINRRS
jgi:hypothetical protein